MKPYLHAIKGALTKSKKQNRPCRQERPGKWNKRMHSSLPHLISRRVKVAKNLIRSRVLPFCAQPSRSVWVTSWARLQRVTTVSTTSGANLFCSTLTKQKQKTNKKRREKEPTWLRPEELKFEDLHINSSYWFYRNIDRTTKRSLLLEIVAHFLRFEANTVLKHGA